MARTQKSTHGQKASIVAAKDKRSRTSKGASASTSKGTAAGTAPATARKGSTQTAPKSTKTPPAPKSTTPPVTAKSTNTTPMPMMTLGKRHSGKPPPKRHNPTSHPALRYANVRKLAVRGCVAMIGKEAVSAMVKPMMGAITDMLGTAAELALLRHKSTITAMDILLAAKKDGNLTLGSKDMYKKIKASPGAKKPESFSDYVKKIREANKQKAKKH